jgi:hypothetical protein
MNAALYYLLLLLLLLLMMLLLKNLYCNTFSEMSLCRSPPLSEKSSLLRRASHRHARERFVVLGEEHIVPLRLNRCSSGDVQSHSCTASHAPSTSESSSLVSASSTRFLSAWYACAASQHMREANTHANLFNASIYQHKRHCNR